LVLWSTNYMSSEVIASHWFWTFLDTSLRNLLTVVALVTFYLTTIFLRPARSTVRDTTIAKNVTLPPFLDPLQYPIEAAEELA